MIYLKAIECTKNTCPGRTMKEDQREIRNYIPPRPYYKLKFKLKEKKESRIKNLVTEYSMLKVGASTKSIHLLNSLFHLPFCPLARASTCGGI
jgi:hypothetical protein